MNIKVWEITMDGNSIVVDTLSDVLNMIENLEFDDEYKIKCYEMSKEKFDSLNEFTGW